jgi:hypothetical protein
MFMCFPNEHGMPRMQGTLLFFSACWAEIITFRDAIDYKDIALAMKCLATIITAN